MKKIVLAVTIVLIAGLGIFLWTVNREDQAKDVAYETWMDMRRPLEVQKENLEQELKNLEQDYNDYTKPKATTQVLFTDLNEQVYSVCYPIMQEFEYTGTLVLSSTQLPGKEGCMSVEQFQELIEAGWNTCIQWEGTSVNRWWNALKKELEKLNIQQGQEIYFPRDTYSESLDSRVSQMGFSIVICETEDTTSPLQKEHEEGIWHVGAMGCMTTQPKLWLREAVAQDANVVYTVGFQLEKQLYNEKSFRGMLKAFDEYVVSGDLLVCNTMLAREHYSSRLNGVAPEYEAKYQEDRANLEAQIADVKKQLEEIDAQYQ